MATRKITLNELKSLVKTVLNESDNVGRHDDVVDRIFDTQDQESADSQIFDFAWKNHYSIATNTVKRALGYEKDSDFYSKEEIKKIIDFIVSPENDPMNS